MDPLKIMFISNGKGEDSIAATVIEALKRVSQEEGEPKIVVKALPLVGNGRAYEKTGAEVVGNWKELPSGGFGGQRINSLFKDISAGLLHITQDQISVLNNESATVHLLVCVGDLYPVALAAFFTDKPQVHIATAISSYFHKYSFLERWFFRKFCRMVLTRDVPTAEFLRHRNVPAAYFGNAMMDDPVLRDEKIEYSFGDRRIVTLAPSSREDAYDNTVRMLKIVQQLGHRPSIAWVLSLAPNLALEKLRTVLFKIGWELQEQKPDQKGFCGQLNKTGVEPVHIVLGHFGSTVRSSAVVIGMTGTGNEQVVGLEKPVFLLRGQGVNSTWRRIWQYRRLLGEALFVAWGSDKRIARELMTLLNNPRKLKKMGEAGKQRMGEPGGAYGIARAIFAEAMRNYPARPALD
jgi:uncharacterized protein (TIGR03492 family)